MSETSAEVTMSDSSAEAFEFVKMLAADVSTEKVELPSFPDIAMRVRQALSDVECSLSRLVRIVSSEPALAARLLKLANSAALNVSGNEITELRTAINRMGFNMVRNAAMAFAMNQIKQAHTLEALVHHLEEIWKHSTNVAAICFVIAKHHTKINADEAMLAGLLHAVGKLYILTRAEKHPLLFEHEETLRDITDKWHTGIARAVIENWGFTDEMANAMEYQEDYEREREGPPDLTDIVVLGKILATMYSSDSDTEVSLDNVKACERIQLDAAKCFEIMTASEEEIRALSRALGN